MLFTLREISTPEYKSVAKGNKALYCKGSATVEDGVVKISVPAWDGVVLTGK